MTSLENTDSLRLTQRYRVIREAGSEQLTPSENLSIMRGDRYDT